MTKNLPRPDGTDAGQSPAGPPDSGFEHRARDVLGLDDQKTLPNALPVRAEQLWRIDRFAADIPFTNTMFVPMGPSADRGLLYETLAAVAVRHGALRTRLAVEGGRAVQIVEDWKATGLELVDVLQSDLTESQPDKKSAVSEFSQQSLDLYAQDGFRYRAFRDENQNVTLGILGHGFFSDAWSAQVLFREVRAVHSALKNHETPTLNPAAPFVEYGQAQRVSLDRDLASHLSYWHRKLKDMPRSRLPYDHHTETGRRGRCYFFLDGGLAASLELFSRSSRVSLSLVLMAIYQLALARWSGQDEILSAAYTADRIRPKFRDTVGFLVANLPVCARFDKGVEFPSFLRDFAKDFYGSYAHRELSCELYDAIFSPPPPFCASVFNFVPLQKTASDSELQAIPSFQGTIVGPDASRPAIYREIYLGLTQYPNGILGKLFYDADRFAMKGMENFIGHFRSIAQAIADQPAARIGTLLGR